MNLPVSGEFAVVDSSLIVLGDPIAVVDLPTGRLQGRVPVAGGYAAVRHGNSLYVLTEGTRVVEVDTRTWQVVRTIGLPDERECIAVSSDDLLLTRGGADDVLIVHLEGEASTRTATAPSDGCELMVDAARGVGYMVLDTESEWGWLALDLRTFREQTRLSIGESSLLWTAYDAARNALYAEVGSELVKVDVS